MWLHFNRQGRYTGRSQRLTLGEMLVFPFVLLFLLMLLLLPFLWPLAVYGGGWVGWSATIAWNILLGVVFVLVLGRPPRRPETHRCALGTHRADDHDTLPDVTPTNTDGPRDWTPLDDWHDDGRRMV